MRLLRATSLIVHLDLACFSFALSSSFVDLIQHESRPQVPAGFSSIGIAPSNATLNLRIALKSRNATGLEDILMQVSTPGHPNYGQHLSKAEVEAYVAPSDSTVQAVTSWLDTEGISYNRITPAGDWIAIPVSVDKASNLFGAQFSVYTHDDTGVSTIRTLAYSIPASLREHIDLVHPMIT
jgi:tripeptidyl-peptidase I